MKCKAKVFIYKRGPNEYRNCTRKAKYKIVWKGSKSSSYVCGIHKNQFINEYQDDNYYKITLIKKGDKMKKLYCQNNVTECHWTRTGKCKAKYAYDCEANWSKERREKFRKIEREAERQSEANMEEVNFGNRLY